MSVLVVGISHRTAPVSLLERVTVGMAQTDAVLSELRASLPVGEAVLLATCNRVEVYTEIEAFHAGVDAVSDLLARQSGVPLEELSKHLYVHWEGQAVLHLFEVASGLDSMVIGESQVLGQLRRAYGQARDGGAAGKVLHELFQQALKVGKRAHSETGIDAAGQSLVSVGLEQATAALGPLAGRDALVVGAGSMGSLAGATLRRAGVGHIVVANRTLANAEHLARTLEGSAVGLPALGEALAKTDVVVTSTGSTGIVLDLATVAAAVAVRGGRPLALLDLALPRDVDPAVRGLPGVTLIDLESLQQVLEGSQASADVAAARAIVTDEVGNFLAWQRVTKVAPTVIALRSKADEVVAVELGRLAGRVPDLTDRQRAEVEQTVRRVVKALLHAPTMRVKELAQGPDGLAYADALRELFGLDRAAPAAVAHGPVALELGEGADASTTLPDTQAPPTGVA